MSRSGQLFDVAVAGAQRMHALVEALLEYSRSGEVGDSTLEPVPVDKVVSDAIVNLQKRHLLKQRRDLARLAPRRDGQPALHLTQVFENLIGNALKYRSEQPSAHLRHRRTRERATGYFRGKTTASEFRPSIRRRFLASFKRLHGDEYPGTGIGLATCKKS